MNRSSTNRQRHGFNGLKNKIMLYKKKKKIQVRRHNSGRSTCACLPNLFLVIIFSLVGLLFVLTFGYLSTSSFNSDYHHVGDSLQKETGAELNAKTVKISDHNLRSFYRPRIAYAITITKDGLFGLDGAAVLSYSIMKASLNGPYDISFIAFVHPNVTTTRQGLTNLGFHVIEVPIPINTRAIKFEFLREKINKNGCCGSSE